MAEAVLRTALFTGSLAVHLAWYGGRTLLSRLCQLIGLDARISLEWLLTDNAEGLSAAARKAAVAV